MGLTKPRAAQIYNLDYKQATRVITTTDITLSGGAPNSVDGVNLALNDRVLVIGQSTGSQNGIYKVTSLGAGSNGTWSRTTDADATGEIEAGMIIMVTEGNVYADTQWKLTTNDPIVIGTTSLTFVINILSSVGGSNTQVQFNDGGTLAGSGALTFDKSTNILSVNGNIFGSYFIGNGSQLTGISSSGSSSISNGTSNVTVVNSGGNVTVGVGEISNVAVFAITGEYVTGVISANGNVTGGNIDTIGVIIATANITGGNVLTGGLISATGNVTGNYILGNGASLTGVITSVANINNGTSNVTVVSSGGNVTVGVGGTPNVVVFATTGEYIDGVLSVSGNITSAANITGGNVLTGGLISATSTITSTDNVTGGNILTGGLISATGNITGGNILTVGLMSATGNISANYFIGNGSLLTGISGSGNYSNANVAAYLPTYPGNLVSLTGPVTTTGNITGDYIYGNGYYLTGISGSGTNIAPLAGTVDNFTGNGVQTNFTLSTTPTSVNLIFVNVNGVYQLPTAYSLSTNVLTMTSAVPTGAVLSVTQLSGGGIANSLVNGSSNIVVAASGNISMSAAGTANVAVVASNGLYLSGTITVNTGNAATAIVNGAANGVGNIGSSTTYFDTVFAKATSAQYADLAEMYVSDFGYMPGTVVVFGGKQEVTLATITDDHRVAGVVSTNPSYLMNSIQQGEYVIPVALTGRVPCKVTGTIRKGDLMVTAGNGHAYANNRAQSGTIIGKALENHNGESGVIEVVVGTR